MTWWGTSDGRRSRKMRGLKLGLGLSLGVGGVTLTWTADWLNVGGSGSGTSATYPQDMFSNPDLGNGIVVTLANPIQVSDPDYEITMVDDDGGLFDYSDVNGLRLIADFPDTNVHTFTLRATGPLGNHVDQVFTITVTPPGGGGDWLLSGGTWNDSGVWADSAVWED